MRFNITLKSLILACICRLLYTLSICHCLNVRPTLGEQWSRIIKVDPDPSKKNVAYPSPWTPVTRGQFKNMILFGIHPDSPINRDVWAKSGFINPNAGPNRYFTLPRLPPPGVAVQANTPKPKVETVTIKEVKAKRPSASLRRKATDSNTLSRRLPKLEDTHEASQSQFSKGIISPTPTPTSDIKTKPLSTDKSKAIESVTTSIPISRAQDSSVRTPQCFVETSMPVHIPMVYYLLPLHVNPPVGASHNIPFENSYIGPEPYPYAPVINQFAYPFQSPTPLIHYFPVSLNQVSENSQDDLKFRSEVLRTKILSSKESTNQTPIPVPVSFPSEYSPNAPVTPISFPFLLSEKDSVKESKPQPSLPGPEIIDVEFREELVHQIDSDKDVESKYSDFKNETPKVEQEKKQNHQNLSRVEPETDTIVFSESKESLVSKESGESTPFVQFDTSTRVSVVENISSE